MAAADGITHIVATPHSNYTYPFEPEINRRKVAELQAAVGDTPKLLLGCDFHLSYDNIRKLIENRSDFTINDTPYVLVELGEHFIPEQLDRVFYEIQVAGLTPIITHPERNTLLKRKPEIVYHWVTRGCLVQITAQSYTGEFGVRAQVLSERWLGRNLVHFFATDAHDLKHRPPVLSRCHAKVAATKGREIADLLLTRNPEAVIEGKPLPSMPQPVEPQVVKRKRSWLSFFRF
jgi:protein-tyrosine phosphatase